MNVNEIIRLFEGLKNEGIEEVEVFGMAVEEDHEYWQDFNEVVVEDGAVYFDYDYYKDVERVKRDEEERQLWAAKRAARKG